MSSIAKSIYKQQKETFNDDNIGIHLSTPNELPKFPQIKNRDQFLAKWVNGLSYVHVHDGNIPYLTAAQNKKIVP